MDYFVHERGICESNKIGSRTRIWAFAHVLPGATLGCDCNVCDNVFIENDVIVGDRVTIKCGVQLWNGVTVEDDVFIGPNVTFTNDPFPRSKSFPEKWAKTLIKKGASIGANATILPGLEIGSCAMVGAGAVVTMSVPAYAVVMGNPARIVSYVGTEKGDIRKLRAETGLSESPAPVLASLVPGVTLHKIHSVEDIRGNLSAGEYNRDIPFIPRRFFMVYDVPTVKVRGQHAHRKCQQFLICINGSCSVLVDNGEVRQEYLLDSKNIGMHIPPMIWAVQYKYSRDAVLLVFASEYYDAGDYIRDYQQYCEEVKGAK